MTVWIGELQWRLQHGYEFKTNPVLEPLDNIECRDALISFVNDGGDSEAWAGQTPAAHTLRFLKSPPVSAPPAPLKAESERSNLTAGKSDSGDSNLGSDPSPKGAGSDPNLRTTGASAGSGADLPAPKLRAIEASWPPSSIVIGNPPFLGDKKMRSELGDNYTEALRKVYAGRVPGGADLVTYWFEKARDAIETNGLGAAGLVATNSIRGGKSRIVLDAIANTTHIYEAWSDEGWVNEGAAVRVSLIAFGHADTALRLNGEVVDLIGTDLSARETNSQSDVTLARVLSTNTSASFQGPVLVGDFEISYQVATTWLRQPNPHGRSNADVIKPISNGRDITSRSRGLWVVDFAARSEADASLFEKPFEHVSLHVKSFRELSRDPSRKNKWWLHGRSGADFREASVDVKRYLATSQVAKHRVFVWLPRGVWPHQTVIAITRADDSTFGIFHSRFHELWSLRMGSSLEDRPRYTPTTCFETFPFPKDLTPADTAHQKTETIAGGALIPADISTSSMRTVAEKIARAAKRLNDLLEAWLNPPEWTQVVPEVIPLGMTTSPYPDRILPKDGFEKDLAERTLTKLYNVRPAWLDAAHKELDSAVAAAYGWTDYSADMLDEEILKRLLALNLARTGSGNA